MTLKNDTLACDGCKRHRADSITVFSVPREDEHVFTGSWPFAHHLKFLFVFYPMIKFIVHLNDL